MSENFHGKNFEYRAKSTKTSKFSSLKINPLYCNYLATTNMHAVMLDL